MAAKTFGSVRLSDARPFFICEAGVNHENSMGTALRMIEEAAAAGADAIKFQSYKAETLVSRFSPAYWNLQAEPTRSQFELFKKHDHFNDDDYLKLAEHCKHHGILFMSTPFDEHFADLLTPQMSLFKIASADLTNVPFLTYCAKKKKPLILSTGASTEDEIREAIRVVHAAGNRQVALLHCVLSYPCDPANANLLSIPYLAERFPGMPIGYSDHVPPDKDLYCLIASWLLGAQIIEKHFTLDKTLPGNDHYHALDPADLKRFFEACRIIAPLKGRYGKSVLDCEQKARQEARRSLIAARDIKKGETFIRQMIMVKRPGTGIAPKELARVIGGHARRNIGIDEILNWSSVNPHKNRPRAKRKR